ncbi:unnamed protein product [Tuber aestivum]|uniref:Uncharacterized protein n=1 Tax=Tuber aestivum TaxID=59557 RepID=A0A292PPH6_9PEZI|nr:unnamed protein product [Tuber aestivum]
MKASTPSSSPKIEIDSDWTSFIKPAALHPRPVWKENVYLQLPRIIQSASGRSRIELGRTDKGSSIQLLPHHVPAAATTHSMFTRAVSSPMSDLIQIHIQAQKAKRNPKL